ncbi:MAG: hypothetical protein QNJ70_10645 [Xenococcaceae cyanobacterium MO_207.B15]|nr:hypothetical protein [Xenococcaceae cyanobacterium MO_207.B15]MDJ0745672.1 hypothetical protein [Xenococcaceae cyanobacterium MO_167.B27]
MLRLEFWLPLPLLGLAFWVTTGLVTEHSFKNYHQSVESFNITPAQAQPSNTILLIKVKVDRDRNFSQVKVKQATQVYQNQEFELATTELEQLETAISQKLSLSPEKVRQLLRYEIQD